MLLSTGTFTLFALLVLPALLLHPYREMLTTRASSDKEFGNRFR